MITQLTISNFILIEHASIPFQKGLNVITGETGAGKSAVVKALSFVLGERTGPSVIRKGASKACVEGVFDLPQDHLVETLLKDSPYEQEIDHPLIIHREIMPDGKGKIFINGKRMQLSFLQKIGEVLVEFSGQSASQSLNKLDIHREIFDAIAETEIALSEVSALFYEVGKLEQELLKIEQEEPNRLRRIDQLVREIEEIDDGAFSEEEEQTLYEEYKNFSSAYDVQSLLEGITQRLEVFDLPFVQRSLDRLCQISKKFESQSEIFSSIQAELEEFSFEIEKLKDVFPFDPARQDIVEQRLEKLNTLRRKYGKTEEEIQSYRKQIGEELARLESSNDRKEEVITLLTEKKMQQKESCETLRLLREAKKPLFEKALKEHLRGLNFAQAKASAVFKTISPSPYGTEEIEIYLEPNPGEPPVSLRSQASGGERSRAMLALHLMLAEKGKTPTLLFDEIDVGLGGRAATSFAQKCLEVAGNFQILCITHQPQIAEKGHLHIALEKQALFERTTTVVQVVEGQEREFELARMKGLKEALKSST